MSLLTHRLVLLCVDAYCFVFWDLPGDVLAAPIITQDVPDVPGRRTVLRTQTKKKFQDGPGRGRPQDIGGLYFTVRVAVVAPYLHLQ